MVRFRVWGLGTKWDFSKWPLCLLRTLSGSAVVLGACLLEAAFGVLRDSRLLRTAGVG